MALAVAPKPKPTEITYDLFKEWTDNVGVRRIQDAYEELRKAAKQRDHSLLAELQARKFKDHNQFIKACPRFSVLCWPSDFAELGSGFVLYFHFMAFLSLLFFVLFILQIPVMAEYGKVNNLMHWQWNDWSYGWKSDDPCACIGNSSGYARTCNAWDMPLCTSQNSCQFQSPGLWVCRSWCFASSNCPAVLRGTDVSLTNQHVGDYVKAYSSCPQDPALAASCTGFRSNVQAFAEGLSPPDSAYVSLAVAWLTPGNYGPYQATSVLAPTLYTICVILVCALTLIMYQVQTVVDRKVDAAATLPNDFAVMVSGLPPFATDDKAILKFFQENAVRDKKDTEIVKVVIGWSAAQFRELIRELRELQRQLKEAQEDQEEIKRIKQRMGEITKALDSTADARGAKIESSGVVVVIFRRQHDLRACLERWDSFWARTTYSDANDACLLPAGNKLLWGEKLPYFPTSDSSSYTLRVQRAANPGDINWENLGVPWDLKWKMLVKTNLLMLLLIGISFGVVYGLNKLQDFIQSKGSGAGFSVIAFLPAIVIAVTNALLAVAARKLGEKEYHDTVTETQFAQALKMTLGMCFNTAGVLILLNTQPKRWYQAPGLVNNVFTMLIVNAIIPALIPLLDVGYLIKGFTRAKLTKEKLANYNQTVEDLQAKKPGAEEKFKEVKAEIEYFKRAYEPSEFQSARRYANALKSFLCCLYYMPVLPWLALVGMFAAAIQYWCDKYVLLRWAHRPSKPANRAMAQFSLRFIKIVGPVGLAIAFFVFLTPSWGNKSAVFSNFIISIIVGGCFSVLMPLDIWARIFLPCVHSDTVGDQEEDYYQAQHLWSKEMKYHKDQFIYKNLPEEKNPEFLKPGDDTSLKSSDAAATAVAAPTAGPGTMTLKGGLVLAAEVGAGADPDYVPGVPFAAAAAAPATSGAAAPATSGPPATYIPGAGTYVAYTPGLPASAAGAGGGGAAYTPGLPASASSPVIVTAPMASAGSPTGFVPGMAPATTGPPVTTYTPGVSMATEPMPSTIGAGAGLASPYVLGAFVPGSPALAPPRWEMQVRSGWEPFNDDCQQFVESSYQDFRGGGAPRVLINTSGMKISFDFQRMTSLKVGGGGKSRPIRRMESE